MWYLVKLVKTPRIELHLADIIFIIVLLILFDVDLGWQKAEYSVSMNLSSFHRCHAISTIFRLSEKIGKAWHRLKKFTHSRSQLLMLIVNLREIPMIAVSLDGKMVNICVCIPISTPTLSESHRPQVRRCPYAYVTIYFTRVINMG